MIIIIMAIFFSQFAPILIGQWIHFAVSIIIISWNITILTFHRIDAEYETAFLSYSSVECFFFFDSSTTRKNWILFETSYGWCVKLADTLLILKYYAIPIVRTFRAHILSSVPLQNVVYYAMRTYKHMSVCFYRSIFQPIQFSEVNKMKSFQTWLTVFGNVYIILHLRS